MTCAMDRSGPLMRGIGSSSERKMWPPERLCDLGLLRKLALEWAANTMSLAL